MSLTDQLRDEIERSFADEPAQRAVEQRIADGRRALRRRRAIGAAALCGVVTVLGTAYVVGSSGPDRDAGRIIAPEPPSPPEGAAVWGGRHADPVHQRQAGDPRGVVVHQRIRNPYGYHRPGA